MATQIIQFPQRGTIAASSPLPAANSTSTRQTQPAAEHHRGLHLVTSTTTYNAAFDPYEPAFEDTQTRANRIVAQVEQEIARQAMRQRQYQLTGSYPATPLPLPTVTTIETPASVARRLFTALLAFARPA